jgi:uncharacterized delta-60 repeat protein
MSRSCNFTLRGFILVAFLVSLICQPAGVARAASGALIPGFGTNGIVISDPTAYLDVITAIVPLADGKIIVSGTGMTADYQSMISVLGRYTANGVLDTSFGTNGFTTSINLGPGWTDIMDVAVQADGKIVAAGMYMTPNGASRVFIMARFCPDGLLDTGTNCSELQPKFGTTGIITTQAQLDYTKNQSYAQSVVIQSDQKIVAGGLTGSSPAPQVFALVRYNTDGSLDTSFNSNGIVTTVMGYQDNIYDLKMDADQKIVAAGFSSDADFNTRFAVARYNSDGSLDTTLNSSGKIITVIGTASWAYSVAIQPNDNKLVVAGFTDDMDADLNTFRGFAVVRYNSNGSLDTGFGSNGQQIIYFDPAIKYDTGQGVAIDSLGRIIVAGNTMDASYSTEIPAAVRLCPDGVLDNGTHCGGDNFGSGGRLTLPIGSGNAAFRAVAVRSTDGNLVVAGRSLANGVNAFTLALLDGGLPTGHTISGNAGVGGATLSYTDTTLKTATADTKGDYSFSVSDDWSGSVTPSKAGYTFTPDELSYSHVTSNQSKQDYAASAITYTIAGSAGISGVTLSYDDGGAKSTLSGSNGAYSLTVSYNWSGTVTPSLEGYSFEPISRSYSSLKASKSGENYSPTAVTYTISGKAGIAGATMSYSDGGSKSATADKDGNYAITVSYNWSGTVTPSKTGYIFNPTENTYANVKANQDKQDFSAAFTAPVADKASAISYNRFTANWAAVPGATGYILDVATDEAFTGYVSGYQYLDAGNVTSLEITGLDTHTSYYYRVRAYNTASVSGVSDKVSMVTNYAYRLLVVYR